ncbi:MAG: cysteine desulfurase family protein [Bacteroidota bacterium]
MSAPIYLDHNATTPVAPEALAAMLPFFADHYGNPSSEHAFGWAADEAVSISRKRIGKAIGCDPRGLTFTSGASEAISLALRGAGFTYGGRKHRIVTVQTEHKAVLETVSSLEHDGFEVVRLPVDENGLIDLDQLRDAVNEKTLLVSVMWANNETGVVQPIRPIAEIAHEVGAFMMSDATQAVGKVPVHADAAGVDLLAVSAHKFYGPKGAGALFVRRRGPRVRLQPQIAGGGQQNGLRAGTLNVPGIVGMGVAAELALKNLEGDAIRMEGLRDRFEARLLEAVPSARVNASGAPRLPNTSSVVFDGVASGSLLRSLRDVAASTGAACQSRAQKPSHVLTAMGLSEDESFSTVRFSLGRSTTQDEIDHAVRAVTDAVASARQRRAA